MWCMIRLRLSIRMYLKLSMEIEWRLMIYTPLLTEDQQPYGSRSTRWSENLKRLVYKYYNCSSKSCTWVARLYDWWPKGIVNGIQIICWLLCFIKLLWLLCKIDFVVRELSYLLQGIVNKILSLSEWLNLRSKLTVNVCLLSTFGIFDGFNIYRTNNAVFSDHTR